MLYQDAGTKYEFNNLLTWNHGGSNLLGWSHERRQSHLWMEPQQSSWRSWRHSAEKRMQFLDRFPRSLCRHFPRFSAETFLNFFVKMIVDVQININNNLYRIDPKYGTKMNCFCLNILFLFEIGLKSHVTNVVIFNLRWNTYVIYIVTSEIKSILLVFKWGRGKRSLRFNQVSQFLKPAVGFFLP